MTLNDHEWRNGPYLHYFRNSVAFGANYVKVVTVTLSVKKSSPKNLVFSDISLMAISAQVTKSKCIIERLNATLIYYSQK